MKEEKRTDCDKQNISVVICDTIIQIMMATSIKYPCKALLKSDHLNVNGGRQAITKAYDIWLGKQILQMRL